MVHYHVAGCRRADGEEAAVAARRRGTPADPRRVHERDRPPGSRDRHGGRVRLRGTWRPEGSPARVGHRAGEPGVRAKLRHPVRRSVPSHHAAADGGPAGELLRHRPQQRDQLHRAGLRAGPGHRHPDRLPLWTPFPGQVIAGPYRQVLGEGCVYPAAVQTLGNQMSAAGRSWAAYLQDMGTSPRRFPVVNILLDVANFAEFILNELLNMNSATCTYATLLVLPVRRRGRLPRAGAVGGDMPGSPPCSCTAARTHLARCCSWPSSAVRRGRHGPLRYLVPSNSRPLAATMQTALTLRHGLDLPRTVVLVPADRGELRAVQRLGERGRRRVLRPRRRVRLRPGGDVAPGPGGTSRTPGARALHCVAPRDPSLATPETQDPEAEMRIGIITGTIKIVITYQH